MTLDPVARVRGRAPGPALSSAPDWRVRRSTRGRDRASASFRRSCDASSRRAQRTRPTSSNEEKSDGSGELFDEAEEVVEEGAPEDERQRGGSSERRAPHIASAAVIRVLTET